MSSTVAVETDKSEFWRGVEWSRKQTTAEKVASEWRLSVDPESIDFEDEGDDPERYEALLDRVETLLAVGVIDRDWADMIVCRREGSGLDLATLVHAAEAADMSLWPSVLYGLAEVDTSIWNAEAVVEVIEKASAKGFFG